VNEAQQEIRARSRSAKFADTMCRFQFLLKDETRKPVIAIQG
jgi:hypothetical protein